MTPESGSTATVDENARRRFEAAWREGRPEPIEHFLQAESHPNYLATLKELVHIELEMMWKAWGKTAAQPGGGGSSCPQVEAYLARFPCLKQPSIVLQFLEQEYRVRCLYGDLPSRDEYRTRFPELVITGREIEGTMPGEAASPGELGQIPGYQVLGFLGRGGMGVVYKARQIRLNRIVALKMISAGTGASAKELARFHTEAEAAARLQHPHIVQIYEVGETLNRPYLALEFVEGGNLAQRLAGAPQPARVAAQLVLTLARAMAVAHQRGIVHRDLKPANVLLQMTDCGSGNEAGASAINLQSAVPKITDFGLAKLLDSEMGQTTTGAPMGTPSYMAPEQALGKVSEISPATDIYALGAILYELLTGRPPFRGETPLSTLEQVRSQDPVPPTRLHPKVPRDLETICLKCLQKERRRRYGTALELAADLERFLAGESICARPTPAWERGIKWAKRRPALAALLGVSGAAAVTVLSVVLVMNARLQQANTQLEQESKDKEDARAEAQANFQQARNAVDEMLRDVGSKQLAQVPQMEPVRRALLEKALRFYQGFLQKESIDPLVRRDTARAYWQVADIHRMLGQDAQADEEYVAAIGLQEKLTDEFPNERAYREDLADSHSNRGNLLAEISHPKEAETAYRAALGIRAKLVHDDPMEAKYRQQLAASYHNLGALLGDQKILAEGLQCLERLVADFPDNMAYKNDLARTCANLAQLRRIGKQFQEAERLLRRSIDLNAKMLTQLPAVPTFRAELANSYNDLGLLLWDMDKKPEAEEAYQSALNLQRRLARDFPSTPDYQSALGGTLHNLAEIELEGNKLQKAREHLEEAMRHQEAALAANSRNPDYRRFYGFHRLALTDTLVQMKEHEVLAKAATEPVKRFADDPEEYVIAARSLAQCVPLARDDARLPQDKRSALADSYAAEAVRMLREAIQRGYRDLKHLKEERIFDDLRSREDFQRLLNEMKAPDGSPSGEPRKGGSD